MARDIIKATIALLTADAPLVALVGTNIYGGELPASLAGAGETPSDPTKAIVLRRVPGNAGFGGYSEFESGSLDVACFGESPAAADEVRRAVHLALKQAQRQVQDSTLLHSYDLVGAPQSLRDPDTQWPYELETWRFLASEVATT